LVLILDAVTLNVIEKGRNVEILKQGLNDPYTVEDRCDYLCRF
jgi:F-type H+-transporting ATPase subunit alpha